MLPTLWVDFMQILVRADPQVTMLRFFVLLPDNATEVVRLQTATDQIRQMIDAFAKSTGYYPVRPD